MGSMLRSDKMTLCDIYIQPEAAFEVLSHLGEMSCVQFLDMNSELQPFQKCYVTEVCRCADMERKLRYIESEIIKAKIHAPEVKVEPKAMQPNELSVFENIIDKWENDVIEMMNYYTSLMKTHFEVAEMYYVLKQMGPILGDADINQELFRHLGGDLSGLLFVVTGTVNRLRCFPFEMMLWRVSRGNIYYRQAHADNIIENPVTGHTDRKVAFLAVCQGEALYKNMLKVCAGFRANIYPCPRTPEERANMAQTLDKKLDDLEQIVTKTKFLKCKTLRIIGRQYKSWMVSIKKAKAIYHNLNMFNLDISRKCLIGQCWIPEQDLPKVEECLEDCSEIIGTNFPPFLLKTKSNAIPPTYHRTNKFTKGFQALINAYGASTYRELNPGLYTIVTFPFLFAMMFGDVGHGFILLAFGFWMIKYERQLSASRSTNEIWLIFFGGRYVIFLLGLFSIFTGFIYNDWFSKSIAPMSAYWLNYYSVDQIQLSETLDLDPRETTGPNYALGVDPIWKLATNKIMVSNSIKMKLSIIIGIIHMIFGIILSFFNHLYFKHKYAIFLEFIPELLFLICLFLWLVIMIYMKWFMFGAKSEDAKRSSGCAPQILILFIDMALWSTTKPVHTGCDAYMFPQQQTIQQALVIIAVICVPVMLFGPPIYLNYFNKRKIIKTRKRFRMLGDSKIKTESQLKAELAKYSVSLCDLMIKEAVHTIEFVLSTISHTASYLRLWALSLAHEQLSEMLWTMILSRLGLQQHNFIGWLYLFFIFAIWAIFTLSILVVMEGVSAFLHTLRLHWVEFMSKFYMGTGWVFHPFSFEAILGGEEDKVDAVCKKKKSEKV